MKYLFLAVILAILTSLTFSNPQEKFVRVFVAPEHSNWEYKVGEKVKFNISVFQFGNLVKNVKIKYTIGIAAMEPTISKSTTLKKGTAVIKGGSLKKPGFLRCNVIATVDGIKYKGYATAGIEPLKIKPTAKLPKDFKKFWDNSLTEIAKVPMDSKISLMPEKCTEKTNVFKISFKNTDKNDRIYGILCVPKKEGKYPALLTVPAAGIRAYNGNLSFAEEGIITLTIGIHGIPVTMDNQVYNALNSGALYRYTQINPDNKDKYYFKRAFLGCSKAVDFIYTLKEFDGENLAVTGGSQGGGLAIVTASLNKKVKWLSVEYPALCDHSGFLNNRAGGWPHLLGKHLNYYKNKDVINTLQYFDAVNFARSIKVPSFFIWGFNDKTSNPTAYYSAYNVIKSKKEVFIAPDAGHYAYPIQYKKQREWLLGHLLNK